MSVMSKSQSCHHRLKWDILEMKADSFGTNKYIFASLHVITHHTNVQKALV